MDRGDVLECGARIALASGTGIHSQSCFGFQEPEVAVCPQSREQAPVTTNEEDCPTSRAVATPTSRSVSMTLRNYNPNPVIDVRRRW